MLPTRTELGVAWTLRALVMVTAIIHMVRGDVLYGGYSVLALAIVLVPAYLARSTRATWPVEIELVYLWLLLSDTTLGNLGGLYVRVPWYDKALHMGDAVLVGMVGFYAVYLAHFLGRTARHPWIDSVAILLVTLGLGALWEIAEYSVDHALHRATQGSPLQGALDDTMWDLILDGIGGAIGAVLGPLYMHRSKRSRARLEAVAELLRWREARRHPVSAPAGPASHRADRAGSARGQAILRDVSGGHLERDDLLVAARRTARRERKPAPAPGLIRARNGRCRTTIMTTSTTELDVASGASRLGALAVNADRACVLGDLPMLRGIVEALAIRVPEPMHCELVALGELCGNHPDRAIAEWMRVRDRLFAIGAPIAS